MKAAWYRKTGNAEVMQVGELPSRGPMQGEVCVRIYAAGVNPTDCKRRAGHRGGIPDCNVIPGYDGSGVVVSVGTGVNSDRVGERVWVWEGFHNKWDGTTAEFVCVDQSRAMHLPVNVTFEEGACLGVPAITACHSLLTTGARKDDTVLITGAAGSVCNYAVQLAKAMHLKVIAVVRGEDKKERDATNAGADKVINTDKNDLVDSVLEFTDGKGVQGFLDVDLGAHLHLAPRITATNGTIVSFGSASNPKPILDWMAFVQRNIRLCGVAIFSIPEDKKLAAVSFVQKCLEGGELKHRIDSRWPIEKIVDAHKRQESGRPTGKIIITLS